MFGRRSSVIVADAHDLLDMEENGRTVLQKDHSGRRQLPQPTRTFPLRAFGSAV